MTCLRRDIALIFDREPMKEASAELRAYKEEVAAYNRWQALSAEARAEAEKKWAEYETALQTAPPDNPPPRPVVQPWDKKKRAPTDYFKPASLADLLKRQAVNTKLSCLPDAAAHELITLVKNMQDDDDTPKPDDPTEQDAMLRYCLRWRQPPTGPPSERLFVPLIRQSFIGHPAAKNRHYFYEEDLLLDTMSYINHRAAYVEDMLKVMQDLQMQYLFAYKVWEASAPDELQLPDDDPQPAYDVASRTYKRYML